MKKTNIIIDTDIGDDIDDAFALAFAANSEELEIVGVTTVFKNSDKRARMCAALFNSLGNPNIPIYAGIDKPLAAPFINRANDRWTDTGEFIPCQYLPEFDDFSYEKQPAVDFLIEAIRKSPGQITLVPIGPLTNIAAAFRKAPDIIGIVKEIVLMGGCFEREFSEWNILCDPEAAKIVFTSGASVKAVGLDVTMRCKLNDSLMAEFRELSSQSCKLITTLMNKWFAHYQFDHPVLHDPLTIGTLVSGGLVEFTRAQVTVPLDKEHYGRTVVLDDTVSPSDNKADMWIATDVDEKRFLSLFTQRVFKG
jgi:purine nucleosidase